MTIVSERGQTIEIQGGAMIASLTQWALGRFATARLEEPQVPIIVLAPEDPSCVGLTGLFRENAEGRSIVICLNSERICEFPDSPAGFRVPARSCILHELAHAWLADNLTQADRDAFLARSPVDHWHEPGGAWDTQGVEHAAEVIMWGLMDELLPLYRIDDPPCTELGAMFRVLTNVEPLVSCEDQP